MMELEDCAYPLLKEIRIGADPYKIFEDVDYAFLVGAKREAQEWKEASCSRKTEKFFITQGRALNDVANPNVKVLVVGNLATPTA